MMMKVEERKRTKGEMNGWKLYDALRKFSKRMTGEMDGSMMDNCASVCVRVWVGGVWKRGW